MENNNSRPNTVLIVIVVFLVIAGIWMIASSSKVRDTNVNVNNNDTPVSEQPNVEEYVMSGNVNDLVSFSIKPGVEVAGVVSYRGVIKNGYFFEGNILVNILDTDLKQLVQSNAMATTEWMTSGPVDFEGNLDFTGLPKGLAYVEIHNDNASGEPQYDKSILIPVIIQ